LLRLSGTAPEKSADAACWWLLGCFCAVHLLAIAPYWLFDVGKQGLAAKPQRRACTFFAARLNFFIPFVSFGTDSIS
jgi:hypothetical protein